MLSQDLARYVDLHRSLRFRFRIQHSVLSHEHRHGGIGLMAPAAVHDGTAAALTEQAES